MKISSASFDIVILRFYLMMIIVIGSFFAGYPIFAILAVPVFLSALAGVSFEKDKPRSRNQIKHVRLNKRYSKSEAA
jgi:hypothetical protein